jgi:hypothetical protein
MNPSSLFTMKYQHLLLLALFLNPLHSQDIKGPFGEVYRTLEKKISQGEEIEYKANEGEIIELISFSSSYSNGTTMTLEAGETQLLLYSDLGSGYNFPSGLAFEGPITITLRSLYNRNHVNLLMRSWDKDTYISQRGAQTQRSKYATIVVPENTGDNVRVQMESSTDLVNWTLADLGVYPPSNAKRFYRLRAVKTNDNPSAEAESGN